MINFILHPLIHDLEILTEIVLRGILTNQIHYQFNNDVHRPKIITDTLLPYIGLEHLYGSVTTGPFVRSAIIFFHVCDDDILIIHDCFLFSRIANLEIEEIIETNIYHDISINLGLHLKWPDLRKNIQQNFYNKIHQCLWFLFQNKRTRVPYKA